jgi:hypothetical protein
VARRAALRTTTARKLASRGWATRSSSPVTGRSRRGSEGASSFKPIHLSSDCSRESRESTGRSRPAVPIQTTTPGRPS